MIEKEILRCPHCKGKIALEVEEDEDEEESFFNLGAIFNEDQD